MLEVPLLSQLALVMQLKVNLTSKMWIVGICGKGCIPILYLDTLHRLTRCRTCAFGNDRKNTLFI